jgi:cytochrome P450
VHPSRPDRARPAQAGPALNGARLASLDRIPVPARGEAVPRLIRAEPGRFLRIVTTVGLPAGAPDAYLRSMSTGASFPVQVPLAGGEPWGFLRTLKVARRNVIEIIPEIALTQPVVSGRTGRNWHMIMAPEAIRQVLKDRLPAYPKSNATKSLLKPGIGESLFIAEGAHWRWQRQAAAPVFRHGNIAALAPAMTRAAEAAAGRIAANASMIQDLYAEMVTATFDVITEVTFSGQDALDRSTVARAIEAYMQTIGRMSLLDFLGVPAWFPRPARILSGNPLRATKALADQAVAARRAAGPKAVPDLLDLILEARDPETGQAMNPAEVRDNLLAFVVAGHETTALALSWALYLLAFDPSVQDRARAEAQRVLNGRPAGADDVPHLVYIRQIIDESLRLYPPAAILGRTAMEPDELCGRKVLPGDTVILPIYALHRSRLYWRDPDRFDPARFAPGTSRDRYSYLPFGDGPRICIGASFAMMEAVIILATLVARFRFAPVPGLEPRPVMHLTLRPEGGVRLKAEALSGRQA